MHFRFCIILLLISLASGGCTDLDDLNEYVTNYMNYTEHYIPPKNNQKLYETSDSTLHDYGEYDFIIVGGGSAGSVVANRLSEIGDWKVLLLEAGGQQNNFSDIPAFSVYVTHSHMDWGYYSTPQTTCCLGMVNRQCNYPRGKVLGGSGVLNAIMYIRGDRNDYDSWAEMGNEGWSYNETLPYFKKSERVQFSDYDEGYHGTEGLLHVNHSGPPSILSEYTVKGCEDLGLKRVDYNGKQLQGVSRLQLTINYNKRDNGCYAFIDPIVGQRSNFEVVINAFAIKIELENNNKATGVEFIKDKKRYLARARKEVVLSGGTINSPQLLMLSGIGPKKELVKHKIPVKNDLPVGNNMKDHVMFFNLIIRSNKSVTATTMKETLAKYLNDETPLTNAMGAENLVFLNTLKPGTGIPNIELIITALPSGIPPPKYFNFADDIVEAFDSNNALTDFCIAVVLLRPKSNGSVTLQSRSPLDFPLIDLNYFSDPDNEDIETVYQGIKFVQSMLDTEGFRAFNATLVGNQVGCEDLKDNGSDRDYWYCAIRRFATTLYHPVGTTRMGQDPKHSVVDNHCMVHGMKNLRVVDAGVMPEIIRGHTNAPTFMIAEKISDEIKKHHGKL